MQHFGSVRKTCADILGRQMGVAVENLLLGPAASEEVDDQLDRDARSLYDGLAELGVLKFEILCS